jgi:uncharacterized protein YhfF
MKIKRLPFNEVRARLVAAKGEGDTSSHYVQHLRQRKRQLHREWRAQHSG